MPWGMPKNLQDGCKCRSRSSLLKWELKAQVFDLSGRVEQHADAELAQHNGRGIQNSRKAGRLNKTALTS